jgi:hypothetical protein
MTAATASGTRLRASAVLRDPHLSLALACAGVLFLEWRRLDRSLLGPLAEGAIAGTALAAAWSRRESLRLAPLLVLSAAFQIAWVGIHLRLGVHGDSDPRVVYTPEGNAALNGRFPLSPYPPGAVGLFAVETWLGRGSAVTANALLMVPFQAALVAAVWLLRTRSSRWLAACIALWPLDTFFWEFRFDLVPAAALAAGVALAHRGRWHTAGWVLGLGALAKWTPALTAVALVAWLVRARRTRDAGRHAAGFALPLLLVNVPLLLVNARDTLSPYRGQSPRQITGESLPYLALRVMHLATPARHYYGAAHVPHWSNAAAALAQGFFVAAVGVNAALAPRAQVALGVAALLPAAFLLTNRIFSPQFFVVIVAAVAVSAALLGRGRRELMLVAGLLAVATIANATLFPRLAATPPGWTFVSAAALLPAALAVVVLGTTGR